MSIAVLNHRVSLSFIHIVSRDWTAYDWGVSFVPIMPWMLSTVTSAVRSEQVSITLLDPLSDTTTHNRGTHSLFAPFVHNPQPAHGTFSRD